MVRKLTPDQEIWLQRRSMQIWTAASGDKTVGEAYQEAIHELTATAGDFQWCWPRETQRCQYYQGDKIVHWWPEMWEGEMKCTHLDFTPGVCPEGRWEDGGKHTQSD